MSKFTKTVEVDAEQILFADADKEDAKKGIPTTTHGDYLRHEGGVYSVLIHLGEDAKRANEGDWLVTENGKKAIITDEQFRKEYKEYVHVEHELTEEDLKDNPELAELGLKEGDHVEIPVLNENHTEHQTPSTK